MNIPSVLPILVVLYCINGTSAWWINLFKPKCFYNGRYYNRGDIFGRTYNQQSGTCIAYKCISRGITITVTTQKCPDKPRSTTTTHSPPTRPPTTSPTTTTPTTTPLGCYYNGKFYPPGTEISRGRNGNHCYFTFCDDTGHVIAGDDWKCGSSTPTPTTTPPEPEPTTAKKRSLTILEQEVRAWLNRRNKH